jgi:hypothetical protein
VSVKYISDGILDADNSALATIRFSASPMFIVIILEAEELTTIEVMYKLLVQLII